MRNNSPAVSGPKDDFGARAVKAGALALLDKVSEGLELLRKVRDGILKT